MLKGPRRPAFLPKRGTIHGFKEVSGGAALRFNRDQAGGRRTEALTDSDDGNHALLCTLPT